MRLKTIWNVKTVLINTSSPHDAYFYKGLSELIVDIDRLIYLSLEKIRKDLCLSISIRILIPNL